MALRNVLQDSCYSNLSVLSVNNNDLNGSRPDDDNSGARNNNNGSDLDAQSNHSNQEGAGGGEPGNSHRSMNQQDS